MNPVDWAAVGLTLTGIATATVKWIIPGVRALMHPPGANGSSNLIRETRESLARLETKVDFAHRDIGMLRSDLDAATVETSRLIGEVRDALDRRLAGAERRITDSEERHDAAERRQGNRRA